MASVFNKTTGQYVKSVHAPDYDANDWVFNPDVSDLVSRQIDQKYWKAILLDAEEDVWIVGEMTQAEKDAIDSEAADKANQVIAGSFVFQSNGNVRNKWLGIGNVRSGKSAPYIVPQPMRISALTYTNAFANADTQVELYKNGSLEYTWTLDDTRWAYVASGLYDLTFEAGDQINIYCRRRGNKNPRDVVVTVHYTVINRLVQSNSGSDL